LAVVVNLLPWYASAVVVIGSGVAVYNFAQGVLQKKVDGPVVEEESREEKVEKKQQLEELAAMMEHEKELVSDVLRR